jgi:hypothetical protein
MDVAGRSSKIGEDGPPPDRSAGALSYIVGSDERRRRSLTVEEPGGRRVELPFTSTWSVKAE